jgi:hypothetical protein
LRGGLAHASPTNRSCPEVGQRRRGRPGRPGRVEWWRPASAHHGGSTFRVAAHPSHHAPRTDHGRPPGHVRIGTHAPSLGRSWLHLHLRGAALPVVFAHGLHALGASTAALLAGGGDAVTSDLAALALATLSPARQNSGGFACGSWWCGSASSWWLPSCGPFLRWLAPRCRLTTTTIHSTDEKDQTPFRAPAVTWRLQSKPEARRRSCPDLGASISRARGGSRPSVPTARASRPCRHGSPKASAKKRGVPILFPRAQGVSVPVNESPALAGLLCSGRYWARTSDPQLVELVLSQLS